MEKLWEVLFCVCVKILFTGNFIVPESRQKIEGAPAGLV
jgi:hypothetical protein